MKKRGSPLVELAFGAFLITFGIFVAFEVLRHVALGGASLLNAPGIYLARAVVLGTALTAFSAMFLVNRTRALDHAEKEFRSVADNAGDAIISLDEAGKVTFFSRGAERLFGYREEETMGFPLDQMIPELAPGKRLAGGTTQELKARTRSGLTLDVEATIQRWRSGPHARYALIVRDVTRQRKEQETLRNQARLLDLAHDAILVQDMDARISFWNQGSTALYGWTSEEAIGQVAQDLLATRLPKPLEAIQEDLKRNGHWEGEIRHRTKDGATRTIAGRWALHTDARGMPTQILQINRDVTDRVRAEEALRESEERFRGIIENVKDIVTILEADGTIRYESPSIEPSFGYSSEELVGKSAFEYVHPDDVEAVLREFEAVVAQNASASVEFRFLHKDGSWRWLEANGVNLLSSAVQGIVVTSRDVTDRKKAEEKFKGLLESAPDAMVIVDQRGKMVLVNSQTEKLFGYAREELLGNPVELLMPERYRDRHESHRNRYAQSPQARPMGSGFDLKAIRKDGTDFPVEISLSPIATDEGTLIAAAIRNVTTRRAAEDDLKRYADELARSNADLEQFAYVASHDLQEPLRMITSYVQLLGRRYGGKLDADADEFIQYAVAGATRMQHLITDLLAFSRVGTHGSPPSPTASEKALDLALLNLRGATKETGARVTHDSLPLVKADPSQLTQLFQNLIGNAIKFAGDKAPRVHVSAERKGREWVLSVKDEGIGIDPKYQERIFVIFQRLHGRDEYPGTGIGLAVCKRIVERHGGKIWVDSEPARGATFRFTLPAVEDPEVEFHEPLPQP